MSDQALFFILIIIAICAIVLTVYILLRLSKGKAVINRALNMSLFLITLPREAKQEQEEGTRKTRKEIISVMEQFYASLGQIKDAGGGLKFGSPHLAFEIATPHVGEEIAFYVAVPRNWEEVLEKQIHGFFPEAQVEKAEDYNIFNPEGPASGSYLKLNRDFILPLKTYQNLEADPINEIVNTLSKLKEVGEGAAFQMIIRPADTRWQSQGLKIAAIMQEGKTFHNAKEEAAFFSVGKMLKTFVSALTVSSKKLEQESRKQAESSKQITPLHQETIKAVEGKASKVNFETNLRLVVSAEDQNRSEQLLGQLESAFAQFNDPNLNSLRAIRVKGRRLKKLIYNFSFRLFEPSAMNLLNTEELTSLLHFSLAAVEAPKVKFIKAKAAAPPPNLPKEGLVLGRNSFRGTEAIARLDRDDRRRHLYVVGQTGTGKSVFLRNMITQDIENGEGVAVLDPHGDSIEKILGLPGVKKRAEDVIVCDPSDLERPLGLNMLEYDPQRPEQKTFIVNEMINIFDKLYDLKTTGGPMFEQYTRNALLLLMDDPGEGATLMEVPKVLADKGFRQRLLAKCRNIVVKDFWEKEAEKAGGEAALANMVPYITSKFNTFIANDYIRPIIGQSKSTLNFREILDQRRILLVSLPKGRLGEANSSLLGSIVVGKLLMAALGRIDIPESQRSDFYLYIDEFQNFTTESIETALSEARKYRLCLTIAHQFIGQLPENVRNAVFGNVGSLVAFRVGADDAEVLVKQFAPTFEQNDLINIDNYNAYIKLLIGGLTTRPFNIATYPPTEGEEETARNVKQLSRLKYGREKNLVEAEIDKRIRG